MARRTTTRNEKTTPATRRAFGYVRVSTMGQVEDGVSLDAQRSRIAAWCEAQGFELAETFADEGMSGGRADNRPGLQAALDAACREGGVLVTYSLSRLSRSTADMLALAARMEKAGADLASLSEKVDTTSAAGRMFFRLMAVLSEFEREQVGERTKTALAHKRQRGEKTGGTAPVGFTVERRAGEKPRLVADAAEQGIVRRILAMRAEGTGYHTIAATLNHEGVAAKTGGRWHAKTVRGVALRQAA